MRPSEAGPSNIPHGSALHHHGADGSDRTRTNARVGLYKGGENKDFSSLEGYNYDLRGSKGTNLWGSLLAAMETSPGRNGKIWISSVRG